MGTRLLGYTVYLMTKNMEKFFLQGENIERYHFNRLDPNLGLLNGFVFG